MSELTVPQRLRPLIHRALDYVAQRHESGDPINPSVIVMEFPAETEEEIERSCCYHEMRADVVKDWVSRGYTVPGLALEMIKDHFKSQPVEAGLFMCWHSEFETEEACKAAAEKLGLKTISCPASNESVVVDASIHDGFGGELELAILLLDRTGAYKNKCRLIKGEWHYGEWRYNHSTFGLWTC